MDKDKIEINAKVLKNSDSKVRRKKFHKKGRDHYKIELSIDNKGEKTVKQVTYKLHPSFKKRKRVSNEGPGFPIEIWTWGTFMIDVEVELADGDKMRKEYFLDFGSQLPISESEYEAV